MSNDQKIKTSAGKLPLDMLPLSSLAGAARVYGYGGRKYAPGNFHTADDDDIARRYVGGLLRHLMLAQNPNGLFDLAHIAALDDESGLPHIDHAICGLVMLRALLIKRGVLPLDPGIGNEPPSKTITADEPPANEWAPQMTTSRAPSREDIAMSRTLTEGAILEWTGPVENATKAGG